MNHPPVALSFHDPHNPSTNHLHSLYLSCKPSILLRLYSVHISQQNPTGIFISTRKIITFVAEYAEGRGWICSVSSVSPRTDIDMQTENFSKHPPPVAYTMQQFQMRTLPPAKGPFDIETRRHRPRSGRPFFQRRLPLEAKWSIIEEYGEVIL